MQIFEELHPSPLESKYIRFYYYFNTYKIQIKPIPLLFILRRSVPRAAKSNIKSMAVISTSSDDDSEKSNDVSETSDIEMKDAESSNVNQSEQGRDGSEYDEMDIEPKVSTFVIFIYIFL
jgi:hypothetical protein